MKQRYLAIVFILALAADAVVTPASGGSPWLPYFSLTVLPSLLLFDTARLARGALALEAVMLWVAAGVNIGTIVFALGLMYLFVRWALPAFLHAGTWQAAVAAAFSVALLGIALVALTRLLPGEALPLTSRVVIGFALSTGVSVVLTPLLRHYYVQ